jgi:hypothetical protein
VRHSSPDVRWELPVRHLAVSLAHLGGRVGRKALSIGGVQLIEPKSSGWQVEMGPGGVSLRVAALAVSTFQILPLPLMRCSRACTYPAPEELTRTGGGLQASPPEIPSQSSHMRVLMRFPSCRCVELAAILLPFSANRAPDAAAAVGVLREE